MNVQYDLLFAAITANAVLFTGAIFVAIAVLCGFYRKGRKADRSNPPHHNLPIEIVWTGIPLGIAMALFVWSAALFLTLRRIPEGADAIYVVGKQWMWKIQHPEGRWENNELHVPLGRPTELIITSEDVIHAFFIPAFRTKIDAIPGDYTRLWFTPTRTGTYPFFCAEFCGTLHSQMIGTVTVLDPADYERWLTEGDNRGTLAEAGQKLFIKSGCDGCHGPASSVRAPWLEGIFGKPVPVQIPQSGVPLEKTPATTILADDRYIHDAIVLPEQEVAAGYQPIMPTFKNRLTEEEIFQLTAYIRSLADKDSPRESADQPRHPVKMTPGDYKARVGFEPSNMKSIQNGPVGTPDPKQPPQGGIQRNSAKNDEGRAR